MRVANQAGRLEIVVDGRAVDVEEASDQEFPADTHAVLDRWDEFIEWAKSVDTTGGSPVVESELQAPVPRPGQIFAVGVNFGVADNRLVHAERS